MVERIQYLLILLLFVLTGSLEGVSSRNEVHGKQSVLILSTETDDTSDAVRDQLSALTHACEYQAESPVVLFGHKFVMRQRAEQRDGVERAFGVRIASTRHSDVGAGSAGGDYVILLGRLLI